MQPSAISKVLAAFLGGALFAGGGAFLYSRVGASPAAKVAPSVAAATPPVSATVPADYKPKPVSEQEPPPSKVKQNLKGHARTSRRTVQLPTDTAQNLVPSSPTSPLPEPTPAAQSSPAAPSTTPEPAPVLASGPAESVPSVREPHVVTLPAGTSIAVRLLQALSSDHNSSGDDFRATLEQPVIVNGFIIADRGAKVLGRVTEASRAGRVQGLSGLVLTVTEINTTDGQRVPVTTDTVERRGVASTRQDAGKMAGAAAVGALIGALAGGGKGAAIGAGAGGAAGTGVVLGTRGKPVTLPVETDLSFRLAVPVTITEHFK